MPLDLGFDRLEDFQMRAMFCVKLDQKFGATEGRRSQIAEALRKNDEISAVEADEIHSFIGSKNAI